MGSKTYDGVRFQVYSLDHGPPHVHGSVAGVVVVVDLLPAGDTRLADRVDAIVPSNAPRNTTSRILRVANENADELTKLWESIHGKR